MSNRRSLLTAAVLFAALSMIGVRQAQAVELLVSGNFESPVGVGEVPGWTLQEFATGSAEVVDSASNTGGADAQVFLKAFAGGGPLHPRQGNFDDDALPQGDVDGVDFLAWQRGFGKTFGALPSDGDATGGAGGIPDGRVNAADFNIWKANFGKGAPLYTNARLTQTVPATPNQNYSFVGESTFEDHYSGLKSPLENDSPFGQITSPTLTQFKLEFLDNNGAVLSSVVRDLKPEQLNALGFPVVHNPLLGTSPAGTTSVRVTAEALNMAWNGSTSSAGAAQSAFFDDFVLTNTSTASPNLLTNGNLNDPIPSALDFWNQVEVPATQPNILRTIEFANHTPGGSLGVWLSNFIGSGKHQQASFELDPVDGTISQTVPAIANANYSFSGWSKFEANYSGGVNTITSLDAAPQWQNQPSPTKTEIRLDFLDVNSAVIGSSVIDVRAARQLVGIDGNANDNEWYQHTLNGVSPAGTRFVRLSALMDDGIFNMDPGQSAFFDDFSLQGPLVTIGTVPEPSSLVGLAIGVVLVGYRRRRSGLA